MASQFSRLMVLLSLLAPSPILAEDSLRVLSESETEQWLEDMAFEWEQQLSPLKAITGKVRLTQESLQHSNEPAAEDVQSHADSMRVRETVEACFHVDLASQRQWCYWRGLAPITLHPGGAGDDTVVRSEPPEEVCSICTPGRFYCRPITLRKDSLEGGLSLRQLRPFQSAPETALDGTAAATVYHGTGSAGRQFMERSCVLDAARLLKMNGALFDLQLKNHIGRLRFGHPLQVLTETPVGADVTSLIIRVPFGTEGQKQPRLVIESVWTQSRIGPRALMLPQSMMFISAAAHDERSHPQLSDSNVQIFRWTWNEDALRQGRAVPLTWEHLVQSTLTSRPNFHRRVEVLEWDETLGVDNARFEPAILEGPTTALAGAQSPGPETGTSSVLRLLPASTTPRPNRLAEAPVTAGWKWSTSLLAINAALFAVCGTLWLARRKNA